MAHITTVFLKKHPNFTLPKVGMDFTIGYGSDRYAWRITEVDPDGKGFTATEYSPVNKAVWPAQDWSFEDENGNLRLSDQTIHCKFSYGNWKMDLDPRYSSTTAERINPRFGCRSYYRDPSF